MKFYWKKITFVALLIIVPTIINAQTTETTGTTTASTIENSALYYNSTVNASDIDVAITPENPGAFETVSLRLDSNSIDLNRYVIQWVTDSFEQKSGMGMRNFVTKTDGYGSRKKITATITGNGLSLVKTITLSPQDTTVLWEATDSYVPPFYRGKKLPSNESLITVSAIPNFQNKLSSLKLNDAVFLWSRNDNRILNVGGYAKDSITIQHNKLRPSEKITVDVSDMSNNVTARKSILVPIINPEIHWYYKNDSNYRKLTAIDRGLRVNNGNVVLVAEPYFFSFSRNTNDLNYEWRVNNEIVYLEPGTDKKELLVQNPGQTGQATFTLDIKNPKTFLQSAGSKISFYFQNLQK